MSWFKQNSTITFLVAQAIFLAGLMFSGWGYMVRLETRVNTLEVRGSPHLEKIDARLILLEGETQSNKGRIERIVDVMTRELGKTVK